MFIAKEKREEIMHDEPWRTGWPAKGQSYGLNEKYKGKGMGKDNWRL